MEHLLPTMDMVIKTLGVPFLGQANMLYDRGTHFREQSIPTLHIGVSDGF